MTRLTRVREALAVKGCPAALITEPHDITWLSGFRGSSGALLVTHELSVIITDFRYRTQVSLESPGWQPLLQATGERVPAAIARGIRELGLTRVSFQTGHATHAMWHTLSEALGAAVELVPVSDLISPSRAVKDAAEIACIRAAAALADEVMAYAWTVARPGLTEQQLRIELEACMLRLGSERVAFDLIVAGGPNSAKCHARPGTRALEPGDLLVLDLGCVVDGYHSDITRSAAIAQAGSAQRAIYAVVHRAMTAGLAAVSPGAVGRKVDAVARDIITDAGHGDDFGHSLGHGVGLQVHEAPNLSSVSEDVLRPGHIVTVEPGIYVEGVGGVRLEQLCLVTDSGCETLSLAPCPADLPIL
ncbi:MAG: aminopeptidase P family protein [Armatimonadetes bacterium]|nr:aminopeptidase P family protein [Armatimonadota bacterium]